MFFKFRIKLKTFIRNIIKACLQVFFKKTAYFQLKAAKKKLKAQDFD